MIFPGVFLTRLANKVIANNTAFDFDTAWAINPLYGTWVIGAPTKIKVVTPGWYEVGGDFTTLGTNYAGASNLDWIAAITRNGITLAEFIVAERKRAGSGNGASADLMSFSSPVLLAADDEIQVIFQNQNAANILVESNPSVPPTSGSDYTTRPGSGAMSPHLYVVYIGAAP